MIVSLPADASVTVNVAVGDATESDTVPGVSVPPSAEWGVIVTDPLIEPEPSVTVKLPDGEPAVPLDGPLSE